jgi:arylsulfatase A-like enzyme/Tfp pilus assembly protein PilF
MLRRRPLHVNRGFLRPAAAWTLAASAALGVGCRRPPAVVRDPAQNVLLVTIDTLRADAIGAYGNASASTPWIDRLAAGGVRFDRAHASTVITLPSHANILSGVYPFRHGVRENAGFRFPAATETVATILRGRGYRTAAFVSAFPLDARFGLTRGFDVYDDHFPKSDATAFRVPERRGADTVAAALRWIDTVDDTQSRGGDRPWFAWVHLYEPHFPYTPREPYASRYRDHPYWGEVAAADAALGPLLQRIVDGSGRRATLVVLTGDHGESLGEHGEMTHGLFAYEGTLHVPLILYQPRLLTPRAVAAAARHVDLLPTVLDAIGAALPAALDGRSLLPLAAGAPAAPVASYFESLSASINRGWAPLYGVVRGELKYIDLPIPELYDLRADPGEMRDLSQSRAADVRELQRLLGELRAADRRAAPARENPETREQLRSLGYLTGASAAKTRYTDADDPKRLIAIDREIEDVVSRYQHGDLPGAIALAERVVRERPDMPISLVHLAFLANEAGDHPRATAAIRKALALNPSALDVAALAGAYLTEAGRADEAIACLKPYATAADPDVDVLNAYGVALATAGRTREALEVFGHARTVDPASGLALVNVATIHLMQGDRDRAAVAFHDALAADPTLARAHNGLGVVAAERHEYETAIDEWRRAVGLDPRDYQALFNLGDLLIRLGRTAEARPYWERYLAAVPRTVDVRDRDRVRRWLTSNHPD